MTAPLPHRIAWFAPWSWLSHWKPWQRWTLFSGMAVGMVIESPIAVIVANEFGWIPYWANRPLNLFTSPLWIASRSAPPLRWFYEVQFRMIEIMLGYPL